MNAKSFLLGLPLLLAASAAVAAAPAEPVACMPVIEGAWVRAAPPGATMFAGYATVKNQCGKPAVVVGVESMDFAEAMIHQTVVEDGVSKMRHADRLPVPAKGELRFSPGGLHLMLMQPRRALPEASRVRIRLLLADGRKVFAEYPVQREAPPAAACQSMPGAVSTSARMLDRRLVNKLAARISLRDAVAALGPAVRDVGSGLHVLEWDVSASDVFRISAPDFCAPSVSQRLSRKSQP